MVWSKSASTCHILRVLSAHTNTHKSYSDWTGHYIRGTHFLYKKNSPTGRRDKNKTAVNFVLNCSLDLMSTYQTSVSFAM